MMRPITAVAAIVIATSAWQLTAPSRRAISQVRVERVTAMTTDDLRAWDARVDQMTRSGDLRLVRENDDVLMPGRHHERLQQLYRGVPVFGGDVVRQTERGVTISIFGSVYEGINVSADPTLTPQDARDAI